MATSLVRLLFVAFLTSSTVAEAQSVTSLNPVWERQIKGGGWLATHESGKCLVVSENGSVEVLKPSGEVWWNWRYKKVSRYISPRTAAIAPGCDAIAIVGSSGYRYTWIVEQSGGSVAVATVTTPQDATFDRTGRLIAIGTGGATLQLHDRAGALQWKRELTDAILVSDLEVSDDNTQILVKGWTGAGIVGLNGHVRWSAYANRFTASRDLKTFVFSYEPNHGPGLPQINVTSETRTKLWSRFALVEVFVSANGSRILATVDGRQNKEEKDFLAESQERIVQLLSRDGDVITSYPEFDGALALSEDGTRVWLRSERSLACLNEKNELLADIEIAPMVFNWARFSVTRNFDWVIAAYQLPGEKWAIKAYSVPPPCSQ